MAKKVDEQELFEGVDEIFNDSIDEMMDVEVGATVVDGVYNAVIEDIKPVVTHYTVKEVETIAGVRTEKEVQKTGKIYNFILKLEDGRQLIDQRWTRDSENDAVKYQSVNVALGNIATQLGVNSMSMRRLLNEKPTLKIWVSRYQKRRNVNYLQPLNQQDTPIASLNSADAPF